MTLFNGVVDSPPPVGVAERFSSALADAISEFHRTQSSQASSAILTELHNSECAENVDQTIAEKRGQLDALLDEAQQCASELSDALGMQLWRSQPAHQYKRASLMATRKRRPAMMSVAALIGELKAVVRAPNGAASLDVPGPQIRIEDCYKRPLVRVPSAADYVTVPAGVEAPDPRITGGQ